MIKLNIFTKRDDFMINYELTSIQGVHSLESEVALMVKKQTLISTINSLEQIVNQPFVQHLNFMNDLSIFPSHNDKQFYIFFNQIPNNIYSSLEKIKQVKQKKNFSYDYDEDDENMKMGIELEHMLKEMEYYKHKASGYYNTSKQDELDRAMQKIKSLKSNQYREKSDDATAEQALSLAKPLKWFSYSPQKEMSQSRLPWIFGWQEMQGLVYSFINLYEKNETTDFSIKSKVTNFISQYNMINRDNFKEFKNICFEPIMQEYEAHLLDKALPSANSEHKSLKI